LDNNWKIADDAKIRNHATVKRARHKTGKEKISHSFSLPKTQIEWLAQYQGNSSELISRLLGDFIETIDKIQPSTVKLAQKLQMLREQLKKAEENCWLSMNKFYTSRDRYNDAISYKERVPQLAQLAEEKLKIHSSQFDEHYTAYISSIENPKLWVTIECSKDETKKEVVALLKKEVAKVHDIQYQNRINELEHEKAINESIYNAFLKNQSLIQQEIAETEKQITG